MPLAEYIATLRTLPTPLMWWVSKDGAEWVRMPDAPSVGFLLALWADGMPYIRVRPVSQGA